MDVGTAFIADTEATELVQPGEGAPTIAGGGPIKGISRLSHRSAYLLTAAPPDRTALSTAASACQID
jgi:hypothetical protein